MNKRLYCSVPRDEHGTDQEIMAWANPGYRDENWYAMQREVGWKSQRSGFKNDLTNSITDAMKDYVEQVESEIKQIMAKTGLHYTDLLLEEQTKDWWTSKSGYAQRKYEIKVTGCANSMRFYNENKERGDQLEFYFIGGMQI